MSSAVSLPQAFPYAEDPIFTTCGRVEAQLHNSEAYSRQLADLAALLGDDRRRAERLLQAIGREAIRLSLQNLARGRERSDPPPPPAIPISRLRSVPTPATPSPPQSRASAPPADIPENRESMRVATSTVSLLPEPRRSTLPSQWVEQLRQIGQELRQAREALGLSLDRIHRQTHIPLHHLKSLECGQVEGLPEEIYVRGFIRLFANALGLDGHSMANALTTSDYSVIPSWYRTNQGPNLRPVHLYLAYGTLIAGAVGGLSAIAGQTNSQEVPIDPILIPPDSQTPSPRGLAPDYTPGIGEMAGDRVSIDIAPPEFEV